MITLKNVSKVLAGKEVLSQINLELSEGDCVLLRGHNGCGKTMLLRMLAGLIQPTEGQMTLERPYRYGVIIENPHFFQHETAFYNLKYLAAINHIIGKKEIEAYLKKLNLLEDKNKKVDKFSLGMKQRLALCQAFMEKPDVILLDEPFNALDDANLQVANDLILEAKEKRKIIVVASHGEIRNIDIFNTIITMDNGIIRQVADNT